MTFDRKVAVLLSNVKEKGRTDKSVKKPVKSDVKKAVERRKNAV